MSKKRTTSNWGKGSFNGDVPSGPSSFEEVVERLRLTPDEYENSNQLKDWVKKNKGQKYVPPNLLKAWGMGDS
jgi:hypothetical protein